MSEERLEYADTTTLAYIGDAVYELKVRHHVLMQGQIGADRLHRAAVKYVRAEAQASALKSFLYLLDEREEKLVKRARNKKNSSKPKNVDPVIYKWATAFEALIGYLYLTQKEERLIEIMEKTISYVEREEATIDARKARQK